MKIILTTTSPKLDADIDPRFGRCGYLLVMDTETKAWEAYENPGLNAPGGAGIKAAQFVADHGAQAALSGDFGPHAYQALQAAGIAMYLYDDCRTVTEALVRFKAGQLQQISVATRLECEDGHGSEHHGRDG
jgi:predicted Fe-Mo cluster-binding NifX family protein